MTDIVARDMYALLFNGLSHTEAAALSIWSPLNAAGTAVAWKVPAVSWATVGVMIDDDASPSSAFVVDSAMPTSVTLTIPQNAPGESGGACELSAEWIGCTTSRTTTVSAGAAVDDTGDFLFTRNSSLLLVAKANPFLSATVTITNGASLNPSAAAEAPGITMGPITASGSVTMLADMVTNGNPTTGEGLPDALLDSLETTTQASKQMVLHFKVSSSFDMKIPAVITGPPSWSDVGGVNAVSFNFTTGGDVEGAGALAPEVTTLGGTSASIFYKAP
ncbi:MAG: hypothetical protein MUQ30_09650 [Anaerolineae bacterium]|nr:hypothetical protein [Anaerolineae bacterium]